MSIPFYRDKSLVLNKGLSALCLILDYLVTLCLKCFEPSCILNCLDMLLGAVNNAFALLSCLATSHGYLTFFFCILFVFMFSKHVFNLAQFRRQRLKEYMV